MRKNHFSVFIRGFFMEKMAVQISKMVLSREKRAFQISMVVFSWEKGFLIFETDFRHSVFRLPWNKTKRLLLKNSPKNNYTRPSHEYFLQDGVYIFHVWPSFGEKAYSAWFCFSMWEILRYSEMVIPVRFLKQRHMQDVSGKCSRVTICSAVRVVYLIIYFISDVTCRSMASLGDSSHIL